MYYKIETITARHDSVISQIIKQVGAEYGAIGEGFGPNDSEVNQMSAHYPISNKSGYFVILLNNKIVGGAGFSPFAGNEQICELRKLFLLPEVRGLGIGKRLIKHCLQKAKKLGYQQCYLDTLKNMQAAISLYEKFGFNHLQAPLDGTIHNGCDVWMLKTF